MKVGIVYKNYKKIHIIYQGIFDNPPKGVEFIVPKAKVFLKKFYPIYKRFKGYKLFNKILWFTKDFLFKNEVKGKADLLHYVQFIPKKAPSDDTPYVIDFEHSISLTDFVNNEKFFNERVKPFLMSKNCKGIIPMTNAAELTLKKDFGDDYSKIKDKIKVIYPAIKSYKNLKNKQNDKMTFLFVGNHVYRKGLHELLEAFIKIPKGKASLVVISDAPKALSEKFSQENIQYLLPEFSHQEILDNFFSKADVFVMPTHRDTFGMVFLDAMSCETPVIATRQFAIPEIVEDCKTGFLLEIEKHYLRENPVYSYEMEKEMMQPEEKLIDSLYDKMMYCINNPKEVKKMGESAKDLFKNPDGKFSIERRNRLLKGVYEKALEIS